MLPAHKKRKLSPPADGEVNERLLHSVRSDGPSPGKEGDVADYAINPHAHDPLRDHKEDKPKVTPIGAYSSNMFQLQVDELLLNVRPRKGRMVQTENALRKLKNIIEHIPNREPKPVRHSLNPI